MALPILLTIVFSLLSSLARPILAQANEVKSEPELVILGNEGPDVDAAAPVLNRPHLTTEFLADGPGCTGFIRADGSYGPYGRVMENSLNSSQRLKRTLLNDDANTVARDGQMRALCPRFSALLPDERINFWIWTFAAISWAESRCQNLKASPCTSGNCVGLMQLEERRSLRHWRGRFCDVPSVLDPENNLKCSLEIMSGQFEGVYGHPPSLRHSYWEKLRNHEATSIIKDRIRLFPNCREADSTPTKVRAR